MLMLQKYTEVIITLSGRRLFKCSTIAYSMDVSALLVDVKDVRMPNVEFWGHPSK